MSRTIERTAVGVRGLRVLISIVAVSLALTINAARGDTEIRHPLDPLSANEIKTAVAVIAASGKVDRTTRAAMISLSEPEKRDVLEWREGAPQARRAFAILRTKGQTYEAVVDLGAGRLESWRWRPGAQPAIHSGEWERAQALVKADPRWRAAMVARGYDRFEEIFCDSLSAGYFGAEEEPPRRLLKMPCYEVSGAGINVYASPIEGVITTVDLDRNEVVDVRDTGSVPTLQGDHTFIGDPPREPAPVPDAERAFEVDGRFVRWGRWSFHLGFDQRFGPVLSLVSFDDGAASRRILYQGHISEVFVPYMDPSENWSFRTYLDAGEYGLGRLASPLAPGIDCPAHALFVDATLSTALGGARVRERAICVFERETAAPLWRHWEALNGAYEGRAATELVVRSIPSIAHYDYVIDWVFTPNGDIRVNIGATGIDAVKAVALQTMAAEAGEDAEAYGSLVAPGLVAVHHDHYFSVRLDLDIDGPVNRLVRERLAQRLLPADHRRRSLWQLQADPVLDEQPLSVSGRPQVWRIDNPTRRTALGHHPGYQVMSHGPTSLLAPDDWPQRRGAFSEHNLWVTAYHAGERHAAGAYPNQSRGSDGLPAYADGENVESADIVLWSTVGFNHVTRPEDWPVLSTIWKGVTLRPYQFFTLNPSLIAHE